MNRGFANDLVKLPSKVSKLERALNNNDNSESLASFVNCLSLLEKKAYLLHKNLSEKVEEPLVKSLIFKMSIDSQKHP